MSANKKVIGIDARFYGPARKGLGRYTQEIVDGMIVIDAENEFVIFLARDNFDEFQCNAKNVRKVLADVRWYTLAEQLKMPQLIKKEKIDLMHFPHFNVPLFCSVDFVVTIHDLILTKFPTARASTLSPWLYWFKNLAYRFVIKNAVRKAKAIITVSQFTKDDLVKNFGVKEDKVAVTYLGVKDIILAETDNFKSDILNKYNIKESFMLYVGNAYPHKNLESLIKVFFKIKEIKNNLQLLLVGKEDYFYERLKIFAKQYDKKNSVIFGGFIPDNELAYLYQHALVYVFPSKYEGFGLPPLEAMAQGCPVASSDRASLPEILGDAAIYFNPDDEADMFKKILALIDNEVMKKDLIVRGREQIKKYDWNKCAKQTLEIYKGV